MAYEHQEIGASAHHCVCHKCTWCVFGPELVTCFTHFIRTRTAWRNMCNVIMVGCKCTSVCTAADTITSMRVSSYDHVFATREKQLKEMKTTDNSNTGGTVFEHQHEISRGDLATPFLHGLTILIARLHVLLTGSVAMRC